MIMSHKSSVFYNSSSLSPSLSLFQGVDVLGNLGYLS